MGRLILIMGEVRESNLSEMKALVSQNAHLKSSLFQFLVLIKLISDILRISDGAETRSRSAEGCARQAPSYSTANYNTSLNGLPPAIILIEH